MKSAATTPDDSGVAPGELVPQPHGGALKRGSKPGEPTGNPYGAPPSALRGKLRTSFEKRLPILEGIADDEDQRTIDRIRAIELLAKYGLGQLKELSADEVRGRLRETLDVIQAETTEEVGNRILLRLRAIWR